MSGRSFCLECGACAFFLALLAHPRYIPIRLLKHPPLHFLTFWLLAFAAILSSLHLTSRQLCVSAAFCPLGICSLRFYSIDVLPCDVDTVAVLRLTCLWSHVYFFSPQVTRATPTLQPADCPTPLLPRLLGLPSFSRIAIAPPSDKRHLESAKDSTTASFFSPRRRHCAFQPNGIVLCSSSL